VLCCVASYCVVSCRVVLCSSVSCCVLLCRVLSFCVVSCRVVLCCVVLCRVVLCCVVFCCAVSGFVVLCCIVLCCAVLCRVVLSRVVSCRVVSCRVVLCRVVSCRVVLCCVVLCCAVLFCEVAYNAQSSNFVIGMSVYNKTKHSYSDGRSQWPRGLKRWSERRSLPGIAGSGTWLSVSYKYCVLQVEVSETDRLLVQRSPTECVCVIECDQAQHLHRVGKKCQIKKREILSVSDIIS